MAVVQDKHVEVENKQGLNLGALEERVVRLVDLVKQLKADNELLLEESAQLKEDNMLLVEENMQLKKSLDSLEKTFMVEVQDLQDLSQEKAMTKAVVDDLISSIDSLVTVAKSKK